MPIGLTSIWDMRRRRPTKKVRRDHAGGRLRGAARVAGSSVRRYPKALLDCVLRNGDSYGATGALVLDHEHMRGPLAAAWLGHATVLLRMGDQWVLTDPVFSERIGMKVGPVTLGMGRLSPTVSVEQLPPLDLILVSHAHFDHLDKPTLKRLVSPATRVITASNTRRLIPRGYGDVRELKWGEELEVGPLLLRAFRPRHWGARTAWDKHRGYNSYVIELPGRSFRRVLYAGDTAYSEAFKQVGGTHLSVFGIGAYDPWVRAHATPEQVWEMHRMARGEYLLPMHHSTFKLSDEPMDEPMLRLLAAAGRDGHRVIGRELGEVWRHG